MHLNNLPEDQEKLDDFDPNKFVCKNGAEAVKELLKKIDVDEDVSRLKNSAYMRKHQYRRSGSY